MKKEIKKFIEWFNTTWYVEYVTITEWVVNVVDEKKATKTKTDNVYWLCWVDKEKAQGKRAKDDDIKDKNYFCIDLDIRKAHKEIYLEDCSDEDIIKEGLNFAQNLKEEDEFFWEWRWIVFSWWGLHIYYVWKPTTITSKQYSDAVGRIYRKWNEIMGNCIYLADMACKNRARIFRLPGSVNQKYGNEVKILAEQENKESRLVGFLPQFSEAEEKEKKEAEKRRKEEIEEMMKQFNNNDDRNLYNEINSAIPAYEIAMSVLPQFKYDGKKNFKNGKWGFTAFYYIEDNNSICNGWSRHFNWWDENSCYNNFSIIKNFYSLTNKETFEFFKRLITK